MVYEFCVAVSRSTYPAEFVVFFFLKQKTAYEVRISDWSSDVCSSDLPPVGCPFHTRCHRKIGAICETTRPPLRIDSDTHRIACHIPLEDLQAVEPVFFTVADRRDGGQPPTLEPARA